MTEDLPVVAVLQEAGSTTVFTIASAARGLCRLLWVVDLSVPAIAAQHRALARFGVVVDTAGRSPAEVAPELARHEVRGIAVLTDPVIPYAAALADELGLLFHSPETAVLLTDKDAQRRRFAECGVPSARCVLVPAGSPPPQGLPVPAVVKPRRGAAARDVTFAVDEAAVRRALADADEDMLVEEFLADLTVDGGEVADMVSVETLVRGGVPTLVAISGRWPMLPPFRETGMFLPSGLADDVADEITAVGFAAAAALGVRDSFLHTEIKRTPSGPRVIEVNGRLGGAVDTMMTAAGGADLLREVLCVALGGSAGPLPAPTRVGYTTWVYPPDSATVLRSVDGLERARALPGVDDVTIAIQVGGALGVALGNRGKVVIVDGSAPDLTAAVSMRHRIEDAVTVVAT